MYQVPTYSFITRVPKSCPHNSREWHTLYEVTAPNRIPDPEQIVDRGTREWRNIILAKGTPRDLTGNYDVDPDFYALTRCDQCDALKVKRWNEAHWEKSPFERRMRFAWHLAAFECPHTLSKADKEYVLTVVRQFHLTRFDFKLLDERPYEYVTKFDDVGVQEWHYKLRQVRNSHNALFDILGVNEGEGYADDYLVPAIPLMRFNDMD